MASAIGAKLCRRDPAQPPHPPSCLPISPPFHRQADAPAAPESESIRGHSVREAAKKKMASPRPKDALRNRNHAEIPGGSVQAFAPHPPLAPPLRTPLQEVRFAPKQW